VMPERNANRLAPATTEPGRDTAIPGDELAEGTGKRNDLIATSAA
jgi:hypothetical protein